MVYMHCAAEMKRKLNDHDVPEQFAPTSHLAATPTFDHFDLDSRLLQAVAEQKWARPTPIQARAIPLALRGKDILGVCSRLFDG